MNFTYLLLVNFYIICWILLYYLVFSRNTNFKLNRAALLTGLVISFLLPFLPLPSLFENPAITTPAITTTGGTGIVLPAAGTESTFTFPFWKVVVGVYWSGVLFTAARFLWKLLLINRLINKYPAIKKGVIIHILTPEHWETFSFIHYLFAPKDISPTILEHEKVHIRQKHSVDNLLTEIVKIFCWFNPAIYLFQKAIKMNHEYLADSETIKIVDVKEYAYKLINHSFQLGHLSLVHPFLNRSHLQKRLIMLQRNRKPVKGRWSYLLLLPALAAILLFTSSFSLKSKLDKAIHQIRPSASGTLTSLFSMRSGRTIEGNIKTPAGKPVENVTILIAKSQQGTITDKNGHFELKNVPSDAVLKISCIGYNSITFQIPENKNHLNVVLYPKPESLNELSVNGYTNKPLPAPPSSPDSSAPPQSGKNQVFMFVEQMPSFPGGQKALMQYLSKTVKYPATAKKAGIQGTVVARFIVNKDGSLSHIRTVGEKKGGGLEEEVMRVVSEMPKWKPGRQNGKRVKVAFSLPVRFKLHAPEKAADTIYPKPSDVNPGKGNKVFSSVEQMPSFPGGEDILMKYLSKNIKYPKKARENNIQGIVIVQFIVEKDGRLTNIKTKSKKTGYGLEKEATRVVREMPKWEPGTQDGKKVRVQFTLPIRFSLK